MAAVPLPLATDGGECETSAMSVTLRLATAADVVDMHAIRLAVREIA